MNEYVEEQREKTGDPLRDQYTEMWTIYVNAFYFILTTITTVGYGDISGSTTNEYLFSMCVEFIGLTFFSFLTGINFLVQVKLPISYGKNPLYCNIFDLI